MRTYLCIDLKSFYASVECVERSLDPMTTDLVVADPTRTEKTICLAVSPSLKAKGVKNRCRVFQIPKNLEYITAPPRMSLYIEYSANIYAIYLKYVSKDDIHVYSIDEAFLDVTDYLNLYSMTARQLAEKIMKDILDTTGITATCGIGTNLYLAKIALDITAKHSPEFIGELDEESYRKTLWKHKPITDFWRIGAGTQARLERYYLRTMEDIAKSDEDFLYRLFGVDAQLLIDHAWGRESTTIADIKAFKPKTNSLTSGQVLSCAYAPEKAKLIVKEMTDSLALDMMDRGLVTSSITLTLGYNYSSEKKPAHGTYSVSEPTDSCAKLVDYACKLFDRIVDKTEPIRRINLCFNKVCDRVCVQYDMLVDPTELERERNMQKALLSIKKRFGKNAIVKGMDLQDGATMMERNQQIGGHKA